MTSKFLSTGELARRLADAQASSPAATQGRVLVNSNLRLALVRFAGAEGFSSLLRRALATSGAAASLLKHASVQSDGSIELTEQIAALDDLLWQKAAVTVTAELLQLLITFIGEPLTWRLVREACPEVFPDE